MRMASRDGLRERCPAFAECPICGKRLPRASIAAHADRCASRSERPAPKRARTSRAIPSRAEAVGRSVGEEVVVDGLVIIAREIPKSVRVQVARAEAVALAASHRAKPVRRSSAERKVSGGQLQGGKRNVRQGHQERRATGADTQQPTANDSTRPAPELLQQTSNAAAQAASSAVSSAMSCQLAIGRKSCSQRGRPSAAIAASYIRAVKAKFVRDCGVVDKFFATLRRFRAASLTTCEVMQQVAALFAGHDDLILEFDLFLPSGHSMLMLLAQQKAAVSAAIGIDPSLRDDQKACFRAARDATLEAEASLTRARQEGSAAAPASVAARTTVQAPTQQPETVPHLNEPSSSHQTSAHAYIHKVQQRFLDDVPRYRRFLSAILDASSGAKLGSTLLEQAQEIFSGGNEDLLGEFHHYLA